ncbi:MAG: glycosyltransferase family protein [Verrucomicrobiota bacterium]
MSPPSSRSSGILLLTNDLLLNASKTTYYLGAAFRRIGLRPFVRDTADARWFYDFMNTPEVQNAKDVGTLMISSKFVPFLFYAGIDHMLSLDMHWLFPPESLLDVENLKHVYSLWYTDLRDVRSKISVSKEKKLCDTIANPKIRHYVTNAARQREGELLGLPNVDRFQPAAPAEFLTFNHPCIYPDRIAFLGGPGTDEPPSLKAIDLIQKKAPLQTLRYLSREEILNHSLLAEWKKIDPQIQNLIADTIEAKIHAPFESALELLHRAGKNHPLAFEKLQINDVLLDAATLIKLAFRYDRPALVYRLYSNGHLDVHDAPSEWLPYGIQAKPHIRSKELVAFYQSYIAHLNIPRWTREATLNEKLFEIAACGRVSFNLQNPDLASCFDAPDEIVTAANEDELEFIIQNNLQHPDELLAKGENARKKVALAHTWDHRLPNILLPA